MDCTGWPAGGCDSTGWLVACHRDAAGGAGAAGAAGAAGEFATVGASSLEFDLTK